MAEEKKALPESDISEWKVSWRDEYMKWMSAFAWTNGGTLHIGVNDDGYVVGLKDYRKLLEDLPNKFRDKLHITPAVMLRFTTERGTNIRYPNGVPEDIANKDINKYACGTFTPTNDAENKKLSKWEQEAPVAPDADGKYYYLEIEVKHYSHLVTYEGVQYTRSGSTLQRLEGSDLERAVLALQMEKQKYFVNKVYPVFSVNNLRKDLIDRARKKAVAKQADHKWKEMSDEAMLRSCGLILTDEVTGEQSITLAAILLFGDDNLIMSVCSQHKTDAIVRIIDKDRYDDRDVIITNLIDSYDRLMDFGRRHLNDRFVLVEEEDETGHKTLQNVSARDRILREIVGNILMHRDFSSGYVAKMVIEKERIEITNANRPHGNGALNLNTFEPFQKNPTISKIFREMGLADELGSGMRNTYKYTKLYSGGEPVFSEDGDIFKIIIPLSSAATVSAGPVEKEKAEEKTIASNGTVIKLPLRKIIDIVNFCGEPKSKKEIMDFLGQTSVEYFRRTILKPLLEAEYLRMTNPDSPKAPNQKYIGYNQPLAVVLPTTQGSESRK